MSDRKCTCGECGEHELWFASPTGKVGANRVQCVCQSCGRRGPYRDTRDEAREAFFRMRDVKEHKITLSVAVSGCDMPAFGGYIDGSVHEPVEEGMFPRGKILLNLDAIMFACVDQADLQPAEIAAECITHELIHAIQDYFCEATTEYGLEEAIEAARGDDSDSDIEDKRLVPVRLLKELRQYAKDYSFMLSKKGGRWEEIASSAAEADEIIGEA